MQLYAANRRPIHTQGEALVRRPPKQPRNPHPPRADKTSAMFFKAPNTRFFARNYIVWKIARKLSSARGAVHGAHTAAATFDYLHGRVDRRTILHCAV